VIGTARTNAKLRNGQVSPVGVWSRFVDLVVFVEVSGSVAECSQVWL